jgi:hypothetical protein
MIGGRKIPLLLLFMLMATVSMAVLPKTMSYQGSLTDSTGAAIPDASYKMRFTIFNAPTLGTQFWQETQNSVQVTGGLFSVELGSVTPFPADLFTNTYLFLEIEVDLSGNATFEANEKYTPRQHLTWSAFARNADLLDSLDSASFLRSDADDVCTGVITFTGASTGWSLDKAAVKINATNVGTNGSLFSVTGNSGWLEAYDEGRLAMSGSLGVGTIWVGTSYNHIGDGVPPLNPAAINSADDLVIAGNLEVDGDIYWGTAKTGYYNVLAADFVAQVDGYQYTQASGALYKDPGAGAQTWYAALHLPQGATITSFKIWFLDNHASDIMVQLNRRDMNNANVTPLALCQSSLTPGESTDEDTTISSATVDNTLYIYYCSTVFPAADTGTDLIFHSALVTYTTTGP